MKKWLVYGCLSGCLWWSACAPEAPESFSTTYAPASDSTRRDGPSAASFLSIQEAFVQLPARALTLEGLRQMSAGERRRLFKGATHPTYTVQQIGHYLEVQERPTHPDDQHEALAHLRLGVYHALEDAAPIVFVSEEWREENSPHPQMVQQRFWQYQRGHWQEVTLQLPQINTQHFFEPEAAPVAEQHWYFDLQPQDIHYLPARLQHQRYSQRELVIQQEAYRVALVWDGTAFNLYRQPMVQYDISEHHQHPSAAR